MQLDVPDYSSYEGRAITDTAGLGFPRTDAGYQRESRRTVASITACG